MKNELFTLTVFIALIAAGTDAQFFDAIMGGVKTIQSKQYGQQQLQKRDTNGGTANEKKTVQIAIPAAKPCSIYDPECTKKSRAVTGGVPMAPVVPAKVTSPLSKTPQNHGSGIFIDPQASNEGVLQEMGNMMGQMFGENGVKPRQRQRGFNLESPKNGKLAYHQNSKMGTQPQHPSSTAPTIPSIQVVGAGAISPSEPVTVQPIHVSKEKDGDTRIKMDNHASSRYRCIGDIQQKIVDTFADWLDHKGRIGYADPAANHNIEDQISWSSSKKLFERYGKSPLFSCGASDIKNFMPSCTDLKDQMIQELGDGKGVLYFNPFGSWGSANRKMHLNRLHLLSVATEAGIPFVSGPQLMHYDANAGAHILEDDELVKKYGAKEDLLTFRSRYSYEFAQKHYGNYTTVREAPDISFMLGPLIPTQKTKYDVFVLMRVQEQNISDRICRGVTEQGYKCAFGDWGFGTNIERIQGEYPPNYAEIGVQMGISTISLGEVIVTDRLQAVILGFLAGKNVLYIDTPSKKIGNVIASAFDATDCINLRKSVFGITEIISTNIDAIVKTSIDIIRAHNIV